jgi:uncharacterized protein (DUF433 family)
MAPALVTRAEAADLSGTSPITVKKAVDQRVVPTRRRGAQTLIAADDVPVLAMLGLLSGMRLSLRHKRRVRDWLRSIDPADELELQPAIVVRRVEAVDEARRRAERYAELRDKWIVRDPEIKNGEPIIRGSRVSVHTLATRIAAGEPEEILAEDFPHISAEAREVAVQYAHANPRRGRPTSPSRRSAA